MNRQTRIFIGDIVWPAFAAGRFLIKAFDKAFLSWWLGPLLQKRGNRALEQDVRREVSFFSERGHFINENLVVLPFDYAEIEIALGNTRFCITRGRDEVNFSLSPNDFPHERYELSLVLAALDSREITQVAIPANLPELNVFLKARFLELNHAFSQTEYPQFRSRLLQVKQDARVLTDQAEWELNRKLSGLRSR